MVQKASSQRIINMNISPPHPGSQDSPNDEPGLPFYASSILEMLPL